MPNLVLSSHSIKNLKALTFKHIFATKAGNHIFKCDIQIFVCAEDLSSCYKEKPSFILKWMYQESLKSKIQAFVVCKRD